jgi:hypothetical protein
MKIITSLHVLSQRLRVAIAGLVVGCSLHVQAQSIEVNYLTSMNSTILAQGLGGSAPDANGLVGNNSPGPDFIADNQRGAIDNMVVGIGRGNDTSVRQGWIAIETAYNLQTSAGDFSTQSDTITAGNGTKDFHFFLAWANHALLVLQGSPTYLAKTPSGYTQTYGTLFNNLKPKIKKAMDYMAANGQYTTTGQLKDDRDSPNRSLINASALALGRALLSGSSVVTGNDLITYSNAAMTWVNNAFVTAHSRNANPAAPLYRSYDGVFLEPPSSLSIYGGYDTSYQAVATRFFQLLVIYFPGTSTSDAARCTRAGRFLERRIRNEGAGNVIDCTHNTRSGPNNQNGTSTGNDTQALTFALLMYDKMNNRSEGTTAAGRCNPGNYSTINGMKPVVFSSATSTVTRNQAFSFNILASNAGLDSLDGTFFISVSGLPSGLSVPNNGFYTYNKSTGGTTISGTTSVAAGNYNVTISAHNTYGTGLTQTLVLTVQ